MDRNTRRLHQNKANKAQVLGSFPANSSGKDGDIVFVRKGTGLSQAVKSGGRWIMIGSGTPSDTVRKTAKTQAQTVVIRGSGGGSMAGAVLRNGSTPFEAVQSGVAPTESDHLATKSYVDSIDSGKLTSVIDAAATPGTGGQHGNLPSGHVCLVEDGGANQDKATLYNVASANSNLLIEDDEDGSGNAFIKFTAQDQSVSLHRFDTIYHYDDTDAWINTSTASGAQGVAFVDTETVTFTTVDQAGSGTYVNKVKVSAVAANDNTTYSTNASTVTGGANFNLLAANPTSTDALKFVGGGTTTVTRTDASTITISSTDANDNYYLNGITKNSNTLTFAVNGATNQTYTFGSNAFNSTAFLTAISSTLATDESASPPRVSILDDGSTVKALEEGTGISIEESATAGGDTVKISSTVDTSGLLTNGIVKVEDYNGSEVTNEALASGPDVLRFADNDGIEWTVSGPSSNTITVTPSLDGYNASNWNTAYGWGDHGSASYLTGNQTITLSGDATGSGTTAITVVVANDSHTHDTRYYTESEVDTSLALKSNIAGPTFTGTVTMPYLRLSGTGDAAPGSTTHAFQSGPTNSYNVIIDQNEVMGRNNGAASTLHLQPDSGGITINNNDGTADQRVTIGDDGNLTCLNVYAKADVYAYYSSDPSLKANKELISDPLDKLNMIGGYSYDWKPEAQKIGKHLKGHDYGVMADEIETILPELVATRSSGVKAVRYDKIIPLLIESIKELKKEIDSVRGS